MAEGAVMEHLLAAALLAFSITIAACDEAGKPTVIVALESFPDYSSLVRELRYNGVAEEMERRSTVSTLLALNNASLHSLRCQGYYQEEIADILRHHVLVNTSLTMSGLQAMPSNTTVMEQTLYYYHRANDSSTNSSTNSSSTDGAGWVNLTSGTGGVLVSASVAGSPATPSRIAGSLVEQPGLSILQLDAPPLIPDEVAAAIPVDILDVLSPIGTFSTFVRLIQTYDVICSFQSWARNGLSLTIWAPTDEAFARSGPDLLAPYTDLQMGSILAYHSVRYYLNLSIIDSAGGMVPSYGGFCSPSTLFIASVNGTIMVDSGRVSAAVLGAVSLDVVAIYAVDKVLIPRDSCPAEGNASAGSSPPAASGSMSQAPSPPAAPPPVPSLGRDSLLPIHTGLRLALPLVSVSLILLALH